MIKNDAFTLRYDNVIQGWEKWLLLMSDEHFDSKHCDRKLLKKHHDQAKERDAVIMKFGDVFDCMGGKYDKRSNKDDLRPEYNVANYFDAITDDAAEFYKEYADNIFLITMGNHEESVQKRHEVNLIKNLAQKIGVKNIGSYSGWIRFFFSNGDSHRRSKTMYYTHGSGGNSPVTKGTIQTNRRAVQTDADYFVSGHNHNSWEMVITRRLLNGQCIEETYNQHHWNLGTYKDPGEWELASGFPPPAKMARWVRFSYKKRGINVESFLAT